MPRGSITIADFDAFPRRRMMEISRADPNGLMYLGDHKDPTPPFLKGIMNTHIQRKFKTLTIKAYDGTSDPTNHVRTFSNALLLHPMNDAIKCRAFPQISGVMAQRWYNRQSPNSIWCFRDLSHAFIRQFIIRRVHKKCSTSIMNLEQGFKES